MAKLDWRKAKSYKRSEYVGPKRKKVVKRASPAQESFLRSLGVQVPKHLSMSKASAMIKKALDKKKRKPTAPKSTEDVPVL